MSLQSSINMTLNRRSFLFLIGATTGTAALGLFPQNSFAQPQRKQETPFQVIPLPYAYNALEPYIDAETMQFHHDKHYVSYTTKFNEAVNKYPQLASKSAEDILRDINNVPEDIRTTVRNNGGGYVNHTMFWEIMAPDAGGQPTGPLAQAIDRTFGNFTSFQKAFNDAGSNQFGSGWAWLVLDNNKQLKIIGTPNQDSPLMMGMYPIMGNDVWEHAYYLNYRNDRGKYLQQWWNVVNWNRINDRYQQALNQ
jgi:superoxide dismutase, Fe-Mn family